MCLLIFSLFLVGVGGCYFNFFVLNIHTILGKCKCWMVCLFFFGGGEKKQLNNCFGKIRLALIRAYWCNLMQADMFIWADFAGWTGWKVLTVCDEWKMALVTVLVEVERVKMVVVCQSAGTVVCLESLQRGLTI